MEASFALEMELSLTAATNSATNYVREALERDLGLDLCVVGDGGAQRLHETILESFIFSTPPPPLPFPKSNPSLSL